MNFNKPFAQSSEDNKEIIFEQLKSLYSDAKNVLEIGSGTGQHAVYFAQKLEHLNWQPTELSENIAGINLWLEDACLNNINSPLVLNVEQTDWGLPIKYDAVFTANTLHIMSIQHVESLFKGLSQVLSDDAVFISYGPFNYNGMFSSESNARFDLWLKDRDLVSGIRDINELKVFANTANMELIDDIEMPVNNRLLVWKRLN